MLLWWQWLWFHHSTMNFITLTADVWPDGGSRGAQQMKISTPLLKRKLYLIIWLLSYRFHRRMYDKNPTHLAHIFLLMGVTFKGNINQSATETPEPNLWGSYRISDIMNWVKFILHSPINFMLGVFLHWIQKQNFQG